VKTAAPSSRPKAPRPKADEGRPHKAGPERQGSAGGGAFDPDAFLPRTWFDAVAALRVHQPDALTVESAARVRRRRLAPDGRLLILAADHPARMVTRAGADPLAMGNRRALLARIVRVLTAPGVDGLMATPDIVDDLLLLSHLVRQRGGHGWLDDKALVGCMNRGGLAGSAFELDDRMTAYTPAGLVAIAADGGKLMVRIDPADPATAATLEACARAIDACHARGLTVFLEAFLVQRAAGRIRPRTDTESLIHSACVAAGLGTSSAHTWLKLPYGPGYERVAAATTLPVLMLGGDVRNTTAEVLQEFAEGMRAGPTVRGVLAGRNISFVAGEDPRAMAAAAAVIVHQSARRTDGALRDAQETLAAERGRALDLISALGDPPSVAPD
jgi:DhnA family fructose-bisphosphate aldolase class Ia